jgi:hypothetical protein
MANVDEEIKDPEIERKRIEFIDPEELITFIQDESLNLDDTSADELSAPGERGAISEDETPLEEEILPTDIPQKVNLAIDQNKVLEKREDIRGRLAIIYTFATFFIFVIGIIVSVIDGINREVSIIDNLKDIISLFSGVFLGTLGFILGYYFKSSDTDGD